MDDGSVVSIQIGRPPRSKIDVVARCHLGLPVVIAVPPLLEDGTPFPTTYWLCCPLAVRRVSRLESAGGIAEAEAKARSDREFGALLEEAGLRYATERDALLPTSYEGPRPSGGVGGARHGVKCLHAHYADHAAGNDNPVGGWVAGTVEPLNCIVGCVVETAGNPVSNPEWREPDAEMR